MGKNVLYRFFYFIYIKKVQTISFNQKRGSRAVLMLRFLRYFDAYHFQICYNAVIVKRHEFYSPKPI